MSLTIYCDGQSALPPVNAVPYSTPLVDPSSDIPIVAYIRPRPSAAIARIVPQLPTLQYRGFGTGGISRSLLANREAAANRNPNSATAQNAFYQVLLKANMPAIVVERYQSGEVQSERDLSYGIMTDMGCYRTLCYQ